MELNNITSTGIWVAIAALLNDNFSKIDVELQRVLNSYGSLNGYYEELSTLQTRFPSPKVGDTAWVGKPYPGIVYDCVVTGVWRNSGKAPNAIEVNLAGYAKMTDLVELQVIINNLKAMTTNLVGLLTSVAEDGFHVTDITGKDVMNYTLDGLDVAKVTEHFISLILKNGSVTTKILAPEIINKIASLVSVAEEGYHFPDATGKDVMSYTVAGFDVAKVSEHFVQVLNAAGVTGSLEYDVINENIYNF